MLLSKFDQVQDEMEQKEAERMSKSRNEVGTQSSSGSDVSYG